MLIHNAILSVAEASATFELLLFWLLRLMSKYCFALIQSLFNSIFPCAQGNHFQRHVDKWLSGGVSTVSSTNTNGVGMVLEA